MYQDIIILGIQSQKIRNSSYGILLLHNNEELGDRYFKSELRKRKLTENNKIENIQRRLKRNVYALVSIRIMAEVREHVECLLYILNGIFTTRANSEEHGYY
jgi:hypothetical protein